MPTSTKQPTEQHLGHKLAEAMAIKKVKQVDVRKAFEVTAATVSKDWLKYGRIGKPHYPKLVEYFQLPYEWWFGTAALDPGLKDILVGIVTSWPNLSARERGRLKDAVLGIVTSKVK